MPEEPKKPVRLSGNFRPAARSTAHVLLITLLGKEVDAHILVTPGSPASRETLTDPADPGDPEELNLVKIIFDYWHERDGIGDLGERATVFPYDLSGPESDLIDALIRDAWEKFKESENLSAAEDQAERLRDQREENERGDLL